jgi:alkanesulfonate monooxygenase SsuD/methylene tetrahydromethanopterin reductase-like flavin-dependent oxidoreductase (luciferase family)
MVAKMVSTMDVLSGGRIIFGVGAGWSQREFEAYSQWDEGRVRVQKTEEGLKLMLRLWTGDEVAGRRHLLHRDRRGVTAQTDSEAASPDLVWLPRRVHVESDRPV